MAVQHLTTIGARFNFLTITGTPYRKPGGAVWYVECRCDCGITKDFMCKHVVSGHTKACGCFNSEKLREGRIKHAMSGSPTYQTWTGMMTRCRNPNSANYKSYGGRGIVVCERWWKFENFLSDMGERPEGMTIDRYPNVNGDYEPGNCRWATDEDQANNRRKTVFLEHEGRRLSVAQWAKETGIGYGTLRVRIKLGWSVNDILTIPPVLGRNQSDTR